MIDDMIYLHGIKLPTGAFLSQISDLTAQNNHAILRGMAAGHPQPMFRATMGAKPASEFSTGQLKTAIDAMGLFGLDTSTGNTDFLWRRGKNLGVRQPNSGGNHKRLRAASGLLYWTELTAQYQQEAMLRCRYKPISTDGVTAPWIPAGSLPLTDLPSVLEVYTLGKVYVNSTFLQGVKGVTIRLNQSMREEGANDDLYDTYCGVEEIDPVITLDGLSWKAWENYGLTGAAINPIVEIYLRRKAADGGHVANGTTTHIKITASYGLAVAGGSQAGANQPKSSSIDLHLRVNSSNEGDAEGARNVLVFDTAAGNL